MQKKKENSTYHGKPVRLSLGTFDEVMGLKDNGNYNSAQDVIHEAVQVLKKRKKKDVNPSQILDSLGI